MAEEIAKERGYPAEMANRNFILSYISQNIIRD
jgi:hypothetical protein